MHWFDTHCHLDRLPVGVELSAIMARAVAVGVNRLVVPGVAGAPARVAELLDFKGVELAWGIHPEYISECKSIVYDSEPWAGAGYKPVALGECGLDRRAKCSVEEQERVFAWHLQLAVKHNLPVIVHLVGHYQRAFDMLAAMATPPIVVLHSWSGSVEMAKRFVAFGAVISISGGHFRRPEKLERLLGELPISTLLLETDAPDMAAPFWQGDYNEPAAMSAIGAAVAEKAGLAVEELAEILYNNSLRIFGQ
ncbi:MAG: TatD family hydrolase [Candidatus Riflebacteria bacterium]|nr:TatD family hydrolase [Candidatus Riflebacteria bacterium]